jgi:MoxR-like ATPase
VLTPHYVDNIGKIKCKSIVPIQPKPIWKDIEEQIELCIEEEDKKLGLILHGKPGNGKTSFIKYVSEKYKLPTYYITFSPEYDNIHLMIMFSQIPARSLVILEDFDSYFDKRTCVMQNSTNGINAPKFTFDTILNSLDGVYNSFNKNIFILTANDVNKIDDSLKHRPSRFKIVREFPDPTRDIINNFVPEPWNKHVSAVNYDQLIRIAEFKNQGYTITKTFEMLSLPLPQEVFNIAQKIYEDRLINNIDGNADSDFLKACQQFDEMNK